MLKQETLNTNIKQLEVEITFHLRYTVYGTYTHTHTHTHTHTNTYAHMYIYIYIYIYINIRMVKLYCIKTHSLKC